MPEKSRKTRFALRAGIGKPPNNPAQVRRGSINKPTGVNDMLTTHRLIQLHNLADDLSSRARVCLRGAANLERIGNKRGAQYQRAKGFRFQVIAEKAARRVEGEAK